MVTFRARKTPESPDIVRWGKWERLFLNVRLLLSKMQNNSDKAHFFNIHIPVHQTQSFRI